MTFANGAMKINKLLIFGLILTAGVVYQLIIKTNKPLEINISGQTMGSITYNITYIGEDKQLKPQVDSLLSRLNQSLSTYMSDSEISLLNKNGKITFFSSFLPPVLQESKHIFRQTNGAFDPTVGPLVNAWGFGPSKKRATPDSATIDSIKTIIGFEKIEFDDNKATLLPGFQLDFSAIAKGYAVDIVGGLLEKNRIDNYLVEIGGEVRCRGANSSGSSWSIGIDDPTAVHYTERKLLAVIEVKDLSLATSGNYRNYYKKDGRVYTHIIDPRTGYSTSHNLLSASVFASNCITADAYATAFMVMGLEESQTIINKLNEIEGFLVYQDENGKLRSFISPGLRHFVKLNKAQ